MCWPRRQCFAARRGGPADGVVDGIGRRATAPSSLSTDRRASRPGRASAAERSLSSESRAVIPDGAAALVRLGQPVWDRSGTAWSTATVYHDDYDGDYHDDSARDYQRRLCQGLSRRHRPHQRRRQHTQIDFRQSQTQSATRHTHRSSAMRHSLQCHGSGTHQSQATDHHNCDKRRYRRSHGVRFTLYAQCCTPHASCLTGTRCNNHARVRSGRHANSWLHFYWGKAVCQDEKINISRL
jgi:hypothetical protein